MSEILFRGKRLDHGEWTYGYYVKTKDYITGNKVSIIIPENAEMHPNGEIRSNAVDDETVCRYTGLKDKNGTKIFDRDILKSDEGNVGIVKWMPEHCAFMIYVKSENRYCYLWDNNFSKIEIVGNIHDNPELLEGE